MVRLHEGWDPEKPGSRYTWRIALAMPTGEPDMHRAERGEPVAEEVIRKFLGERPGEDAGLGEVTAVNGSSGRGAEGWVAVAEWTALAFAAGILGNAGWAAAGKAGKWLQDQIDALRGRGQAVMVSRGGAVLLAVNHVLGETSEKGPLKVEAAEDPISMTGDSPSELGYAGIEPWLVSLVNAPLTKRYVVAISAAAEPLSMLEMEMTEWERTYSRLGPPEGGD